MEYPFKLGDKIIVNPQALLAPEELGSLHAIVTGVQLYLSSYSYDVELQDNPSQFLPNATIPMANVEYLSMEASSGKEFRHLPFPGDSVMVGSQVLSAVSAHYFLDGQGEIAGSVRCNKDGVYSKHQVKNVTVISSLEE